MKDILVDNTLAKNFCFPLDPAYKDFIQWLRRDGVLIVTQRLITEYIASTGSSPANTSMPTIVDHLTRCGRLTRFTKKDLEGFKFSSGVARRLRCNLTDHGNLKAVMLSFRKFALSHDDNFRHDVNNYPGFRARAEKRPQDLPYA